MPYSLTEFTYSQIITDICRLVGHPIPADPAGSTDPAVLQMGAAVNFSLEKLLTYREWQELTKKATISVVATVPGETEREFELPEDFEKFVDQSQWASDSNLPAGGPLTNQQWMASIGRGVTLQLTIYWQMRNGHLYVLNPPTTAVDFDYMYLSKAQVVDGDDDTLFKNRATKNSDTFKLDGYMISLLARYHYLEWKGFDASAAARDFLDIYESKGGSNKGAPVLSLNRSGRMAMISANHSVPDTGFGS